jgi:hypothetical protein
MWDVIILCIESTPSRRVSLLFEKCAYFVPGTSADVLEYNKRRTMFVDPL